MDPPFVDEESATLVSMLDLQKDYWKIRESDQYLERLEIQQAPVF
jgi:hypothetical protein